MDLNAITEQLTGALQHLSFSLPVTHVYNPLQYARPAYRQYLHRFGGGTKEILLIGMNPGPWGMAQTGVPFGEIDTVKRWLKIDAPIGQPPDVHPKRPVLGLACRRREISGQRLWGWARQRFTTPERFFKRFFVANYCPLLFIEASGRNRTPNQLKAAERKNMLAICDRALRQTVELMQPEHVIGVGRFAEQCAARSLAGLNVQVGGITHPSPANPRAHQNWSGLIEAELSALGIIL